MKGPVPFVIVTLAVLLGAGVLFGLHMIQAGALVTTWALVGLVLALMILVDCRRPGSWLALLLGAGLAVLAAPAAFAETIASPAGDAGFWGGINGAIAPVAATVVAGAVAWIAKEVRTYTKVRVTSELEAQVRQTALTGVYKAFHELEVGVDDRITPARRLQIIAKGVTWVMERMPGPAGALARLGFGQSVVEGIVIKMLGHVLSANPVLDLGEATFSGNPGETPALDHAAGPARGGR